MSILKNISLATLCLLPFVCRAQSNDTLSISEAIGRTLNTYPSLNQAEEAVRSASYNIKMAEAAFLPIINASASYTRLEPNPTITFGDMSFAMQPANNYSAGVSVRQLLYGFGKNTPKVDAARVREDIALTQQFEVQQSLALNTVQMYYMVCFAREAIIIKNQELADYEEMLRQVELRANSGSSTKFDLLNTKVSKSAVSTQMTGLTANLRSLQVQLSMLVDTTVTETIVLESDLDLNAKLVPLDQLLQTALTTRTEMIIATKQVEVARLNEMATRRAYNPSLELSASGGTKNGYPMLVNRMKMNYNAGVSLSVPIYDGHRRKHSVSLSHSAYNSAVSQTALIARQITQQVSDNYYKLISDYDKAAQLTMQVELAQEAYNQATVNYNAGAITNLELLTSSTNLSASRLQLLQARINYVVDLYNLRVSLGEKIW